MNDAAAQDEQIREMNEEFAAKAGFTAEEEFDAREATHDAAQNASENADTTDAQIREMNERLAAKAGFTAEEEFDAREATHDLES